MDATGSGVLRLAVGACRLVWWTALGSALAAGLPAAAAPVVYSNPTYESPVRGDPDDLLLIAGYGLSATDRVVYQAVSDTTQLPDHPATAPRMSSAVLGTADVVSANDAPYSLTVRLPAVIAPNQSYVLWVQGADRQWSSPVLINDARPVWITPDTAFATAQLAGLPRELKVVGRNLQPTLDSATVTQVRLVGKGTGTTYTLAAKNTTNDSVNTTAALERYVAVASLPTALVVDQYAMQVSRDGTSWVSLLGNGQSAIQTLTVRPDPAALPAFLVSDPQFADPVTGPCQPNDGIDDTACILLAIRAAASAGGGTVVLGPGTWTMANPGTWPDGRYVYSDRLQVQAHCTLPKYTCGVSWYGLIVPVGVNLQGAGSDTTSIEQTTGWTLNGASLSLFTLQGNNTVSGISFVDDNNYTTTTGSQSMFKLGLNWWFAHSWSVTDPVVVSNVIITDNLFNKPFVAIANGSLPMDHIYVTNNTFGGAYAVGLGIEGDGNDMQNLLPAQQIYPYTPYHFCDSVISQNIFYPSSQQVDPSLGSGGVIATEIGSGLRVDFSNNVADGTVTTYLYDPNDPPGFRAAFFWSTGINQEMTLVSNNSAICPGDKNGDGEAIAYDGAGLRGGVPAAQSATGSAPWANSQGFAGTAVTVQGTITTAFTVGNPAAALDISGNPSVYYRGFWAQVVQGKGKGQWRKIEEVSLGSNASGPTMTVMVTPAFDVLPDSTSRVVVQFGYWQNATINNYVDQRTPMCTKGNMRLGGRGGLITWYAGTGDSAMEGNQQYDTSGILLNHTYAEANSQVAAGPQSFNEIRGNLLQGNYNWGYKGGHAGGIQLGFGAFVCSGTCPSPSAPDLGYGITIAHNTIIQADATDARQGAAPPIGAIGLNSGWSTGPIDASGNSMPQIGDATLIYHNSVQNISNTISGSTAAPRVGIGVDVANGTTPHSATSWHSVLYANACNTVDIPVSDFGLGTKRVCLPGASSTCECAGIATADVGVSATSLTGPTSDGGNMTYVATVTNHSTTVTATQVALLISPSEGVQVIGTSFATTSGSCDSTVSVCILGDLTPGQTVTVTLDATLPATGAFPVTFSVTHHDADSVVTNDSTTISACVG